MKIILLIFSILILGAFVYFLLRKRKPLVVPDSRVIKDILQRHVLLYQGFSDDEKLRFENRVQNFLQKTTITGIKTNVEDLDKVLIASAAIIPIFAFKNWEYRNIHEVLLKVFVCKSSSPL